MAQHKVHCATTTHYPSRGPDGMCGRGTIFAGTVKGSLLGHCSR